MKTEGWHMTDNDPTQTPIWSTPAGDDWEVLDGPR